MGEAPSRILREGLTSKNLNQLFDDVEFVKRFEEAYIREPFTPQALQKISAVVIPKRGNSRLNAIQKLSVNVQLSPSVKQLCEQLRKDASRFSVEKFINVGKDSDVVLLQDLESTCLAAWSAADKAQYYDVVESILCLTVYWHGLASDQEKIADRLSNFSLSQMPEDAINHAINHTITYCRELSLRGLKIFTFCSEFLKDAGTVFHLPREAKAFIVGLGLPTKKFRIVHEELAKRLINSGIQDEAKHNEGGKILDGIEKVVKQTLLRNQLQLEPSPSAAFSSTPSRDGIERPYKRLRRDGGHKGAIEGGGVVEIHADSGPLAADGMSIAASQTLQHCSHQLSQNPRSVAVDEAQVCLRPHSPSEPDGEPSIGTMFEQDAGITVPNDIIDSLTSIADQGHLHSSQTQIITPSANITSAPTTMTSTSISTGITVSDREHNDSGPRPNKQRLIDTDTADGDPGLSVPHAGSFNINNRDNPISNEPGARNNTLHTATYTSFENPGPFSEHSLLAQLPVQGYNGEQLRDHSTGSPASGPEDTLLGTMGGGRNESSLNWHFMFEDVESLSFEGQAWNCQSPDWNGLFERAEAVNFEGDFENISGWA